MGDKPLIVVAAGGSVGKPPQGVDEKAWKRIADEKLAQKRAQAELSRKGKFVIAEKSGHEIHLYQPGLAVKLIREVVDAVRKRN